MRALKYNSMLPCKNPNLIISRINNVFYSVVNPFVFDGLKVINHNQYEILNLIDGKSSFLQLSRKTGFLQENIVDLCRMFEKKGIVNFTNEFPEPVWNTEIQSMHFWIHTTNDCCLHCSYCYIHTLGLKDFIDNDIIGRFCSKIIETTQKRQLKMVSLRLAGGEPFLKFKLWQSHLLQLRNDLNELNCQLNITFLTNLVLLNNEIIRFIKDNSFGIGVSLDGINDFQNNTRHFENGNGSFEIVSKNIQRLIDNNISFGIMTVVSNANLDGLEALAKFVIEKKIKFRFSLVHGEELDVPKLINVLYKCYDIFLSAIDEGYQFSKYHSFCNLKFLNPSFQTCSKGFCGGALYTDGNIYFCQKSFGIDTPNGSIFEDDDLLSIIQRKTYYNDIHPDCKQCNLRYVCTNGCPMNYENGKDPHCIVYKEIVPIVFRLIGKEKLMRLKNITIN